MANGNKEVGDLYDQILTRHGYNPLSKRGTTSSIHAGSDWTIPLRLEFSHHRDIEYMKWSLYQTCLKKTFTEAMYRELEAFASSHLPSVPRAIFDSIKISDLPFSTEGDANAFEAYLRTLKTLHSRTTTAVPESRSNPVSPLLLQKMPEDKSRSIYHNTQLHNRVRNGDLQILKTDEEGNYFYGDPNDINWSKSFKTFFKKLIGQLNAYENGHKNVDVSSAWDDALGNMGENRKFFMKFSRHWPDAVRADAIRRDILDDDVYGSRKYSSIDSNEATACLSKPFPDDCETTQRNKSGDMTNYTLHIAKLLEKKCAYQEPDSDLIIVAPSDGCCFWKVLAHLGYSEPAINPIGCHESYLAAVQSVIQGTQGHHLSMIEKVSKSLGISVMTYDTFRATISLIKEEDLGKKNLSSTRTPILPCVVLHKKHACLALYKKNANKKYFSFAQIEAAFLEPLREENAPQAQAVENNAEIKYKKLARKVERQRAEFAREKINLKKEAKEKLQKKQSNVNPIATLKKQIHYSLRKTLEIDPKNLPDIHQDDALIAQYVLDFSLKLKTDVRVPFPQSKTAYVYLASLQKKKQHDIFKPESQKVITPYTLRSDILGKELLPERG